MSIRIEHKIKYTQKILDINLINDKRLNIEFDAINSNSIQLRHDILDQFTLLSHGNRDLYNGVPIIEFELLDLESRIYLLLKDEDEYDRLIKAIFIEEIKWKD